MEAKDDSIQQRDFLILLLNQKPHTAKKCHSQYVSPIYCITTSRRMCRTSAPGQPSSAAEQWVDYMIFRGPFQPQQFVTLTETVQQRSAEMIRGFEHVTGEEKMKDFKLIILV